MKWWTAACTTVRRCDVERGSRPNLGACNSAYAEPVTPSTRGMVAKPSRITFGVLSGRGCRGALFRLGAWVHESVIVDGDVLLNRVNLNC